MCGPFALLMSYVSEFHGMKYRPTVMMIIGMFFSLATISLPTIGWLILPIPWSIHIASEFSKHTKSASAFHNAHLPIAFGYTAMRSWQMYLAICALPSFIGAMGLVFLPESPRFLLSNGHNSEALDVLRTIYSWNTGKPKSNFPVCTEHNVTRIYLYFSTIIYLSVSTLLVFQDYTTRRWNGGDHKTSRWYRNRIRCHTRHQAKASIRFGTDCTVVA